MGRSDGREKQNKTKQENEELERLVALIANARVVY